MDSAVAKLGDQLGIRGGADAMGDTIGSQQRERLPHGGGSTGLAGVRGDGQPRLAGDAYGARQRDEATHRLVAGHVEGDHAPAGPGRHPARFSLGPVRTPAAEDHPDEAERWCRRRAGCPHRGFHHRVPEGIVVGGRPEPHLRVADAVRC